MTRRALTALALAAVTCGVILATNIRFVPVPERVAVADLVAVGTVTAVEEKSVEGEPFFGSKKERLKIAAVRLKERLLSEAGETVRVAFVAKEDQPRDGRRIPTAVLAKDMELLLFLRKRPDEDFYRISGHFGTVGRGANPHIGGDLEAELSETRVACKIMADPQRTLKSMSDDDRMLAAYVLATRYRTHPIGVPLGKAVQEEEGAEESRAIMDGLLLLAERQPGNFYTTVYGMNPSKTDGFEGPFTAEKVKDWVRANAGTYRIKRLVPSRN